MVTFAKLDGGAGAATTGAGAEEGGAPLGDDATDIYSTRASIQIAAKRSESQGDDFNLQPFPILVYGRHGQV